MSAEQSVPSGLTAVLVSSAPFWIVGAERLMMSNADRLTVRHVIGLAIGFSGIVVLVWPEIRVGDSDGFLGGVWPPRSRASVGRSARATRGGANARRTCLRL